MFTPDGMRVRDVCGLQQGGFQLGEQVTLALAPSVAGRVALLSLGRDWVKCEPVREEYAPGHGSGRQALFTGPDPSGGRGLPRRLFWGLRPLRGGRLSHPGALRTSAHADEFGGRDKPWRQVGEESQVHELSGSGYEAPAMALLLVRHMKRNGGVALDLGG